MTLLRHAGAADAEAIAALHIASWQAAYRGALPDEFLDTQSLAARTETWRERLVNPRTPVLVLDAEPGLLGFAASGPTGDGTPLVRRSGSCTICTSLRTVAAAGLAAACFPAASIWDSGRGERC